MPERPSPASGPPERDLYRLLDELDRLEELLEAMTELGVSSRAEAEVRLAALNREIDERPDA